MMQRFDKPVYEFIVAWGRAHLSPDQRGSVAEFLLAADQQMEHIDVDVDSTTGDLVWRELTLSGCFAGSSDLEAAIRGFVEGIFQESRSKLLHAVAATALKFLQEDSRPLTVELEPYWAALCPTYLLGLEVIQVQTMPWRKGTNRVLSDQRYLAIEGLDVLVPGPTT